MKKSYILWKRHGVLYGYRLFPLRFWWDIWKPCWHEGRGRYFSIGLWFIAIYRGY